MTSRALFISVAESIGDLRPHPPGRVAQRLLDGDAFELGPRPAAERAAAGRQHDAARPRRAGCQPWPERWRCVRCRPAAASPRARAPDRMTSGPAMTSVSLFATATVLPASRAAQVPARPAAPTMAETTMSMSGSVTIRRMPVVADKDFGAWHCRGSSCGRVGDCHPARPMLADLVAEKPAVTVAAQAHGRESVGQVRDDIERAGADRPGRPEDDDAARGRMSNILLTGHGTPRGPPKSSWPLADSPRRPTMGTLAL